MRSWRQHGAGCYRGGTADAITMTEPPFFRALLRDWRALPCAVEEGVKVGFASPEPKPGWVPLKGLSPISDALAPEAYAARGFAGTYNKAVRQFRRRLRLSAL